MSNNRMSPGCSAIILVIIGLFYAYDVYVSEPREKAKEKEKLEKKWSKGTVDYLSKFDCKTLQFENIEHKIEKYFVIESHLDHPCKISNYTTTDEIFTKENSISEFYTKKIDEANTIIWIQSVGGNSEANYTDGSPAKRLIAEINFIDKKTKIIYKTERAEFGGNPRNQITRSSKDTKGTNVYFGDKPYDEIFEIIRTELNK